VKATLGLEALELTPLARFCDVGQALERARDVAQVLSGVCVHHERASAPRFSARDIPGTARAAPATGA
jgi:hypothetical protein